MSISNTDDIIDSREVTDRIEELESDREPLTDAVTEAQEAVGFAQDDLTKAESARVGYKDADDLEVLQEAVDDAREALEEAQKTLAEAEKELEEWDSDDDGQELKSLKALEDDCTSSEWSSGLTLIHEDHFEDYAQELARDIGAINDQMSWPCNCIDWGQAAKELQSDYSVTQFGDQSYYYRD